MKKVWKSLGLAITIFALIIISSEVYRESMDDYTSIWVAIFLTINWLFIAYYLIVQMIKSFEND